MTQRPGSREERPRDVSPTAAGVPARLHRGYKRTRKRLKLALGLARAYQVKRSGGADARWHLIRQRLDGGDRSLLDVGSNLGFMTERAAAEGRFALGLEPNARLLRAARRRTRRAGSLAFARLGLDPESVLTLPRFDVVLCLSVHHYWVRSFGEDVAWRMIGDLMRCSRRKFFLESASVKRKFGMQLDFEDLDRRTLVEYNQKRLEAAADPGQSVRLLGETPCRPREPFRLMFLVERRPDSAER